MFSNDPREFGRDKCECVIPSLLFFSFSQSVNRGIVSKIPLFNTKTPGNNRP